LGLDSLKSSKLIVVEAFDGKFVDARVVDGRLDTLIVSVVRIGVLTYQCIFRTKCAFRFEKTMGRVGAILPTKQVSRISKFPCLARAAIGSINGVLGCPGVSVTDPRRFNRNQSRMGIVLVECSVDGPLMRDVVAVYRAQCRLDLVGVQLRHRA